MTEQTPQKPEWAKTAKDLRRERGEKPSKWRWLIWLIVIAAIVAIVISQLPKPTDAANAETEPSVAKLETKFLAAEEVKTLVPQTVRHVVKVNGSVQPLAVASVPALISAQIETVTRRAGDSVRKGDLLVAMDTESLDIQKAQQEAALQASEAQLALAESQLKRTQEMAQQGIAPSSQLEQAESSVQAQQANLLAQKTAIRAIDYQLNNANVYSPLTGIVSARQTEPGQFVGAGSPLMEVVDLSVMELVVNVSTKDSAQINVGMNVSLRIEGLPGKSFTGTVRRISPVAARGTRTIPVYITINNPEQTLRGGMFATGQITLNEQANTITIPQTAIHQDEDNRPYVLVVNNTRVLKQPITLGQTWGQNEDVEVSDGLANGDTIVILPLPGLNAGDVISLIEG